MESPPWSPSIVIKTIKQITEYVRANIANQYLQLVVGQSWAEPITLDPESNTLSMLLYHLLSVTLLAIHATCLKCYSFCSGSQRHCSASSSVIGHSGDCAPDAVLCGGIQVAQYKKYGCFQEAIRLLCSRVDARWGICFTCVGDLCNTEEKLIEMSKSRMRCYSHSLIPKADMHLPTTQSSTVACGSDVKSCYAAKPGTRFSVEIGNQLYTR